MWEGSFAPRHHPACISLPVQRVHNTESNLHWGLGPRLGKGEPVSAWLVHKRGEVGEVGEVGEAVIIGVRWVTVVRDRDEVVSGL